MKSTENERELKRKLDTLLSLDMSAMGHEAKARHRRRIERAQQAYDDVIRRAHAEPPSERTFARTGGNGGPGL